MIEGGKQQNNDKLHNFGDEINGTIKRGKNNDRKLNKFDVTLMLIFLSLDFHTRIWSSTNLGFEYPSFLEEKFKQFS